MRTVKSAVLFLSALSPAVLAQTFSSCKDDLPSCPVDPAQKNPVLDANFGSGGTPPAGWKQSACKGKATYDSNGVSLTVAESGDCPALETEDYFFFGMVEVKMKAAPGAGIVSSIVMESDALDEIDWEFIGGENYRVQSNYFGKGDTSSYDRMVYIPVSDPQNQAHTYAVNWTSSAITWFVDGAAVRTLLYADAQGGTRFPQTPMKLKVGIWAGGDPTNNAPGTVAWAMGGQPGTTNYADGPFSMYVESVKIVNYSPADSYTYGDNSGTWQSIKVQGGSTGGIVSPDQIAAEQSTVSSAAITVSTGSAPPVQPLATVTANSTTSSTLVTSVQSSSTSVETASATAQSGSPSVASTSTTSSVSASHSSGPVQATGAASSARIAGGVSASALLGFLMAVFA
ncbi:uncharacterized protein PV09_08225 [Verruconis gallopava]|uniref:Crh-like protein n=1 Tax=Verruconis gallopava TaxID=253628 RepID=A0A0D2AM20_9PEZI|nr:uncharacterized protein PV09_08225 [Verruconis gallopava]KIW00184.1 hypothetical protein PV09_08225 [Verruconis gallopava]